MSPQKILIINIFGVGDVLFTTPLIENLKHNWPDCVLGYVCNQRTYPLLKTNPHITKFFVYERDHFRRLYEESRMKFFRETRKLLNEIKQEHYDAAIDLTLNPYASFLMWFIGIKERIGFYYKNRSPFLTRRIPLKGYEGRHVVDYYLDILQHWGLKVSERNLKIYLPEDHERWFKKECLRLSITDGDLVVAMVPGGGASWGKDAHFKRWSAEKYAELADKMIEKFSAKVILLGDFSERDLCLNVSRGMRHRCYDLSGSTDLLQTAAVFKRSQLAVVNDGGPLHIAVASGARTISIFGPVDENVYGPYPHGKHIVVTQDIACRPCYRQFRVASCQHHNCLNTLQVDQVLRKVEEIL